MNCAWCQKTVPSRRKDLQGIAKNFCTNRCLQRNAEEILAGAATNFQQKNFPKIKIPKIKTRYPVPSSKADIWEWISWSTVELIEKLRETRDFASQNLPPPLSLPPLPPPLSDPDPPSSIWSYASEYYQQNMPNQWQPQKTELEILLGYLGLGPQATREEIERTYKAKAKLCHPDLVPGGSDESMKKLNNIVQRIRELL